MIPYDSHNEEVNIAVGWVCHLPKIDSAGNLNDDEIDLELELGPCETPTRELVWDPNCDDINHYTIRMKAQVSINS